MEQIDSAIRESVAHDRIVTIVASAAEFGGLDRELSARCADGAETTGQYGVRLHEYWGRDEEGNDWRVHLEQEYIYTEDS